VFVDIGCGRGFFTLPAARIVGKGGKVYGVDIDDEILAELRVKADKEGLDNIVLKTGEAERVIPCRSCADFVFYGIDLHDFMEPKKALANARIMLKKDGRLIDLDWKKETMEIGPPVQIRFSHEEARELIEEAGFKTEHIAEAGKYHYIIIARS